MESNSIQSPVNRVSILPLTEHLNLSNTTQRTPQKDVHFWDWVFAWILKIMSLGLVVLLASIGVFLLIKASLSIQHFGWRFISSSIWDPVHDIYGAFPVIYGTLVSSLLAVLIATPLSVGAALFLNELAPKRVAQVFGFLIEMLAAIPSVVYGLWGVFVLAPWIRTHVEPFLEGTLGFLPFFQGPHYGVGMLAAGMILAIMITPTVFTISREVFRGIPTLHREAALALGATRWEMIKMSVLNHAKSGLSGAIILGLGRAFGETMAVTMVIGNRAEISASLFAPSQTMASVLANEYAEATSDLQVSALIEIGLVLFMISFIMNSLARIFIKSIRKKNPQ